MCDSFDKYFNCLQLLSIALNEHFIEGIASELNQFGICTPEKARLQFLKKNFHCNESLTIVKSPTNDGTAFRFLFCINLTSVVRRKKTRQLDSSNRIISRLINGSNHRSLTLKPVFSNLLVSASSLWLLLVS